MLLVQTRLGPSVIHGTGLFAAEFIPKGTRTWSFRPDFDRAFTEEEFARLPEPARKELLEHAYKSAHTGRYILCADNARFANHSDDPNCLANEEDWVDGERGDIAVRDIQIGEELTNRYSDFDCMVRENINPAVFTNAGALHGYRKN